MKLIRFFSLILCVLCLLPQVSAAGAEDISVSSGSHSVDAAVALSENKKLLATSKAVVLYETNSDTMVYGWNLDDKIYPASMVKLMTAIVALENGNLSDIVIVSRSALDSVAIGSGSAGLKRGEELSLESLLYCMMCGSANDAAAVIAEHVGGSTQAFLDMMNQKAREIGCTGTQYTNVHGLHDDGTYTTARDVCRVLEYGLENPLFAAMFSAKTYTVPATNKSDAREIQTPNYMMSTDYTSKYFDERVTGGKTGSTNKAGRCLAVTAQANGMNLIGIVMGAVATYQEEGVVINTHGSFEEMKVLLDFGCNGYEYRQIFYENQALAQYPVKDGENAVVTKPVSCLSTVLPVDLDETKLRWEYEDAILTAPVQEGQFVSQVRVWYDTVCLAQTELVAFHDVAVWQPKENLQGGIADSNSGQGWLIALWIIAVCAVVYVVIFVVSQQVHKAKVKSRRQRRQARRKKEG